MLRRLAMIVGLSFAFYAGFNPTLSIAPIQDVEMGVSYTDQSGHSTYTEYELCHAAQLHIPVTKICGL